MDLTPMLTTGVQNLVNSILTDGWTQIRDRLARRRGKGDEDEPDAELAVRLDAARSQALAISGQGTEQRILQAYWMGYLTALQAERPAIESSLRDLAASPPAVSNSNSGTVDNLVQAANVKGGIRFGS